MTKSIHGKSRKPAAMELHDEALDHIAAGFGSLADGRYVLTALASQTLSANQTARFGGGIRVAAADVGGDN